MKNIDILESNISKLIIKFSELRAEKSNLQKKVKELELEVLRLSKYSGNEVIPDKRNNLEEENKKFIKEKKMIRERIEHTLNILERIC